MALTGVFVTPTNYVKVRDQISLLSKTIQSPAENTLLPPLVFHARALLQSDSTHEYETDTNRLLVYSTMVRILNEHRLPVFRMTYTNRSEIVARMPISPNLYSQMYSSMCFLIGGLLREGLVTPVMDGIPSHQENVTAKRLPRINAELIRAFAGNTRYWHQLRSYPMYKSSMPFMDNLGEPVFADSEHSTCLQLTDVVSHLILQSERRQMNNLQDPLSHYKQELLNICESIDPTLLHLEKYRMEFH